LGDLQAEQNRANRVLQKDKVIVVVSFAAFGREFPCTRIRQKHNATEARIHRQDQFLALAHLSIHFSNKIPVNPKKTVNAKIAVT
jgi:hypothetical protein